MEVFDYETYYKLREPEYTNLIKKTGVMKAFHLSSFLKGDEGKHHSIAEVGTGPGDVLNYFDGFKIKIGMDISLEGLQIQVNSYFKKKVNLTEMGVNYNEYYKKRITRSEILRKFSKRKPPMSGNLALIKIDPQKPLPFEDKSIDYMILCDIIEHVEKPVAFLKDMNRVSEKLLIKVPIEKALLLRLSCWLNNMKYGVNHPSGHLFYWNIKDVLEIFNLAEIQVIKSKYLPSDLEFSEQKTFFKKLLFRTINFLDKFFFKSHLLSRIFLGGSFFVYAKGK